MRAEASRGQVTNKYALYGEFFVTVSVNIYFTITLFGHCLEPFMYIFSFDPS